MLRLACRAATLTEQRGPAVSLSTLLRASFSSTDENERTLRIDRSGLIAPVPVSHASDVPVVPKEPETELVRHIKSLIMFRGGPITMAEYMSEVLTNPTTGYYTQRDVFGTAGDFITSPEISQMFGEMVGIWCVALWQQMGQPGKLRLVELGPGRGTLMADLLRGTSAFQPFSRSLEVSMVEISPVLRRLQWEALRCRGTFSESSVRGISGYSNIEVSWHRILDEVPTDTPTLYIAHEFLDALPVHQFQKTDRGWCERLVDVASPDSPLQLRMVLSPGPTPASSILVNRRLEGIPEKYRPFFSQIEISPQSMVVAEGLARRVAELGGAALIIDYGQDGPYEASLQAIRQHKFVGLLEEPGNADLSARVDYSALRQAVEQSGAEASCHGPISQTQFLLSLGMEARLHQLLEHATDEQAEGLVAGFKRLVCGSSVTDKEDELDGMGHSYKAFCIMPHGQEPPIPFTSAVQEGRKGGGKGPGKSKK